MPRDTDKPIRLRFECTRYPHWGGQSGYAQFIKHLHTSRFSTRVHAASDSDADLPRWLDLARPGLRRLIRRGRMPWYKLSDLNAEIGAFADCLRRRIDIVHFLDGEHSGQFLPALLELSALNGVRTIASFHQPPQILKDLVNPAILRRFDQIVLVSPSQLSYFRQHVAEDRLHVILHGVDTQFFRPDAAPQTVASLRCITVGHWLRDWTVFRAVAERLPLITFDIVTDKDVGLEGLSNVRQHRNISDDRLVALYQNAQILFLPLIDSTANNALLEGIACGLPVISSDLDSTRAYLPAGEAILVAENKTEGFVEALLLLQTNRDLRVRMGQSARARAESLSWTCLASRYESLYEAALLRPRLIRVNSSGVS